MTVPFVPFGTHHFVTLGVISVATIAVVPVASWVSAGNRERYLAWGLVLIVAGQELAKKVLLVALYGEPWVEQLPLGLCSLNAFLCAAMLMMRSYRLFEVAYFWSMGGSIPALITPDVEFGFPHATFWMFFIGHGMVVVCAVYAIVAYRFRPRLQSVAIAVCVTVVYAALMIPVNVMLGTNYLYLCAKPAMPSLMDYLGPWPWYVAGLLGLLVVVCLLCWLPFGIAARRGERGVY